METVLGVKDLITKQSDVLEGFGWAKQYKKDAEPIAFAIIEYIEKYIYKIKPSHDIKKDGWFFDFFTGAQRTLADGHRNGIEKLYHVFRSSVALS